MNQGKEEERSRPSHSPFFHLLSIFSLPSQFPRLNTEGISVCVGVCVCIFKANCVNYEAEMQLKEHRKQLGDDNAPERGRRERNGTKIKSRP